MKKYISLLVVQALLATGMNMYAQSPELRTLTEDEVEQWNTLSASKTTANKEVAKSTTYDNPYVPNSVTIDQTKMVGEIPFTSGVSSSGAMTYNVPIEIYPGVHGFQPQVSLTYNHLAGNGIVGMGWNIGGLSSIARTTKNMYYDNAVQGINLNKTDAFVLDGMRLIKLSGETTTQIKYETEQGNIKVNATVSENVVKYFTVLYPNGNRGIYGYSTNTADKLHYPLTSLTDVFGNVITYAYTYANNHYKVTTITYGGASNASIEFQYTSRLYPITTYEAGLKIFENQLLQNIVCKFNTEILRTYGLSYQIQKNSHVLSQIGCAALSNSLNPLRFYYGANNNVSTYSKAEIPLAAWYSYSQPGELKVVKGKFDYGTDNDGFLSLPYYLTYYSYKNGNTRQFQNQYTGTEEILMYTGLKDEIVVPLRMTTGADFIDIFCADINGKGEEEVIKVNNSVSGSNDQLVFKVYALNGYACILQDTYTFNFSTLIDQNGTKSIHPKFYYTGDFNGDGKMEVLAVSCHQPWGKTDRNSRCYLFDLESGAKLYEGNNIFPYKVDFFGTEQNNAQIVEENTDKIYIVDYDGDGKSDICLINNDGVHIYKFSISGSTYSLGKVATYTGLKKTDITNRTLLAGEVNGDGKVDLLLSPPPINSDFAWSIFYSKGNGQFEQVTCTGPNNYTGEKFFLQDVNGDGLTDLIRTGSYNFRTYISRNGTISASSDGDSGYTANSIVLPTNLNSRNYFGQIICLRNDGRVERFAYSRNDTKEKLLTGVASSTGVVNKNHYEMINQYALYTKGENAVYPYENFQGSLYVPVSTEQYFNGQKTDYNTYAYSNAVIHKRGLGFRGFETITAIDKRNRNTIRTYDPYNYGVLKSEESPVAKNTYTPSVSVASNKIVKINITGSSSQDKLKNVTVTSSYIYDTYGNPTSATTDYGGGITETITNVYSNNTSESGYMLGFMTDMTKITTRNGATFTERNYIPVHSNGIPVVKVQYINGNQVFEENFVYDTTGNVTNRGIRNYNSTFLHTNYEYDSYGRLTKETDPLGLSIEYEYSETNGSLSETKNHKQQSTSYAYDGLGRVRSVYYPDGTVSTSITSWAAGGTNGLYCVTSSATGQPISKVYYDALGRETRSTITQFNGTQAHTDKLYDSQGRLEKISVPFVTFSTARENTYQYDTYDRPLSFTEASGRTTSWSYSGNSVTTTKEGIASTQTFDTQGNLISVSDQAGTITYNLRPDGQPSSIVAPGNVTTSFEYDNYGRQTAIVDPSAGRKSFTYDSAGNIYTQTDANGKTITMNYDSYGRLTSKVSPELTTRYRYNADNQLVADSINANLFKSCTYDTYGRLLTEKETVASNKWLQKKYTYTGGNVSSLEYSTPTGIITTENYTYAYGYCTEIKLNGTTSIWKLNAVNAFGQPTNATTGSFTRTYGFNAYGQPTSRQAGSFQNFSYTFAPATGNLTARHDIKHGKSESFTYDNLNRLLTYNGYSATYDVKGNLTKKSDTGNSFSYNTSGKPYAISGVTSPSNAIPLRNQNITYTSFDRPAAISENGDNAAFTYNGSGDRVMMKIKNNSTTAINGTTTETELTRYYLSGCYENDILTVSELTVVNGKKIGTTRVVGTKEKLYLGGDYYSAPAVYVKENTGNWNIYYICRDYLGSITHITNSSGSVTQELSYDAWGRLRNPSTLAVYAPGSEPALFLGRGYTGHEHLTPFGLINMNARLYDPAVGRFLSADPYVQFPDFSQSFNRYSYCLNNPLRYTDPSGELLWFIPNISWSKSGGLSIGFSVVVGIPGVASVQAGVGYGFKNNDLSGYVGATAAFNTVYASASTSSGFSVGWSAGMSLYSGFPISTNFTTLGVNYNVSHNSWSGNLSAWTVDKGGWTFNPSVSVMVYPEHTTNLVRGQGFRSNNQVLSRFVANGNQQRALDYFGFKGDYDAGLGAGGQYDSQYDCISYGKSAFDSYDHLLSVYKEETFHQRDFLIYKSKAPSNIEDLHAYEEWRAQMYLYKGQGLYPNSGVNWEQRINMYGNIAGVYNTVANPNLFQVKWWYSIYKIPRRW